MKERASLTCSMMFAKTLVMKSRQLPLYCICLKMLLWTFYLCNKFLHWFVNCFLFGFCCRLLNYTPDLNYQHTRDAIIRALYVWSDVAQLSFHEVQSGHADIYIQFSSGYHQDGYPFDGPGTMHVIRQTLQAVSLMWHFLNLVLSLHVH